MAVGFGIKLAADLFVTTHLSSDSFPRIVATLTAFGALIFGMVVSLRSLSSPPASETLDPLPQAKMPPL
jgi:hypothetical protein